MGLEIVRERNEDLILCRDERMTDYTLEGRFRTAPTYHLFNQDMAEYGYTSFYDDVTFEVSVGNKMLAQRRLDYMQRLFQDQQVSERLLFYRIKGLELD